MRVMFPFMAMVRRELISNLRRPLSFFMVTAVVGLTIVAVIAAWPSRNVMAMVNSGYVSRKMMEVFSIILVLSAGLLMPGLAGASVTVEKERRTYDLLHLTLIRPSGILVGKLMNTAGFFLIVIVSIVPVAAAVLFLVGVDWRDLVGNMICIMSFAVSCAACGLLCSVVFRRSFASIPASYAAAALLPAGGWILLLAGALYLVGIENVRYLEHFAGWSTFINLFDHGRMKPGVSALFVLWQSAMCGGLLLAGHRLGMRSGAERPVRRDKPIDDGAALLARRRRFPFYLIDPLRRKDSIGDGRNPMLVKEVQWGLAGRGAFIIRAFYISLVLFFIISISGLAIITLKSRGIFNFEDSIHVIFTPEFLISLLIAPAVLASAFTKESESGNLDMLRMTMLSPHEIVTGKVYAGLVSLAPIMVSTLLVSSICSIFFFKIYVAKTLFFLTTAYITYAVCLHLALALGLFASVAAKSTGSAVIISYALTLFFFAGIPILLVSANDFQIVRFDEEWLFTFSPIVAFAANMGEYHGLRRMDFYWPLSMAIFSVLGLVFMVVSYIGFARRRLRDV